MQILALQDLHLHQVLSRRVEWEHRLDSLGAYLANLPDEEADDAE